MSFLVFFTFLLHADGGVPLPIPPAHDDAEVVQNLELLELMDETSEYELLEELSVER
ncbi:MAG: hypothetical protein H6Q89_1842 [Myxococcaceae bacterium]|nr:hypothetical protein [Myxococcaceae bacterium]